MGKIHCRITRRHGVSGTDQQRECLRATIATPTHTDSRQMGADSTIASSFNSIDMAAAIESVRHYLCSYLSDGGIVHLDGIGSFQLSVGLTEMVPADAKVTARQIGVKGITFRPSESLMKHLRLATTFVIDEDRRDATATTDEALDQLRAHFAACRQEQRTETITVRRFAALTATSYNTAKKHLRALVADGCLAPLADVPGVYQPGPNL